ncbi:unnamed protein product [Lota lota]
MQEAKIGACSKSTQSKAPAKMSTLPMDRVSSAPQELMLERGVIRGRHPEELRTPVPLTLAPCILLLALGQGGRQQGLRNKVCGKEHEAMAPTFS